MEEKKDLVEDQEVVEEEIKSDLEEKQELVEEDFDDIEERVYVGGDEDPLDENKTLEIQIHHFDCDEFLKAMNNRDQVVAQVDSLAGEIERKKILLNRLLEKEGEFHRIMMDKKRDVIERYHLSEDFNWEINFFEGIAKGKIKE